MLIIEDLNIKLYRFNSNIYISSNAGHPSIKLL